MWTRAPLYAAHDVGMHTAAVAQIVSQLHNHSGDDAREVLQNAISKLAAAATAVLPPIPETDLPQPEPTLPAEIPPWPKQTSFEAVTAAVKAVTATAPQAKVCDYYGTSSDVDVSHELVLCQNSGLRGLYWRSLKCHTLSRATVFLRLPNAVLHCILAPCTEQRWHTLIM